jgi:hypothetical protein
MASQEDIKHQQTLLTTHRRNLALYINQQSMIGAAYIPPAIANGIRESRDNIARIKGILRTWGVAVEDHPDDDQPAPAAGPDGPRQASGSGVTINISGGDFRGANVPIGNTSSGDINQQTGGATMGNTFNQPNWNVAGNVYNIARDMNVSASSSKDEFLAALRQFKSEIDKAQDLPADKADEMKEDVDTAIKAIDKPQPNKERAVERLTTIQKVLDGLKGNVGSALALGNLIGQVLLAAQGISF